MKCWKLLALYTGLLHVVLMLCYAWYSTWLLEVEDELHLCQQQGGKSSKDEQGKVVNISPALVAQQLQARGPDCEPYTYYCRDDPIKSEEKRGNKIIRSEAHACKNSSLMGEVAKYLDTQGWKRVNDAFQAAFVMDDGISFLVSGNGRAGACERIPEVQTQIIGAFHSSPEVCKKFELFRALRYHFGQLHASLVGATWPENGHSGPIMTDADVAEGMFQKWTFIPPTYEMSDPSQRRALFARVPCEGRNTDWIVKQDQHGGRGIIEVESYEELRRKFLDPEMDSCVEAQMLAGKLSNESDTLEGKIAYLSVAFRGGERQRFRANLDQHRDIVQYVVRPLLWDGDRFVARVFFAALRTGRTRSRPVRPLADRGVIEMWDVGIARYDIFLFDAPYFMRHSGLVSDHSHKKVVALNASALDAYVAGLPLAAADTSRSSARTSSASMQGPKGYVAGTFLPQVERIARICWEASEKPFHDVDARNTIEPDGSYQFFAGDFIIDENLNVALLEFSSGMAFDHLRESEISDLLPLLGSQTANLLLAQNSVAVAKGQKRREHRSGDGAHPHWRKLAERPLLPHP